MKGMQHVELELPKSWKNFKMPGFMHDRLQYLLDEQDGGRKLTKAERREAEALVELNDMLSLLKIQALHAAKKK